jgi:hypothetical protein
MSLVANVLFLLPSKWRAAGLAGGHGLIRLRAGLRRATGALKLVPGSNLEGQPFVFAA